MIVLQEMPGVLCPKCVKPGGLRIKQTFRVKPMGDWPSSGGQMTLAMREVLILECLLCRWFSLGQRSQNFAVFNDPHVATQAAETRGVESITSQDAAMLRSGFSWLDGDPESGQPSQAGGTLEPEGENGQ